MREDARGATQGAGAQKDARGKEFTLPPSICWENEFEKFTTQNKVLLTHKRRLTYAQLGAKRSARGIRIKVAQLVVNHLILPCKMYVLPEIAALSCDVNAQG